MDRANQGDVHASQHLLEFIAVVLRLTPYVNAQLVEDVTDYDVVNPRACTRRFRQYHAWLANISQV